MEAFCNVQVISHCDWHQFPHEKCFQRCPKISFLKTVLRPFIWIYCIFRYQSFLHSLISFFAFSDINNFFIVSVLKVRIFLYHGPFPPFIFLHFLWILKPTLAREHKSERGRDFNKKKYWNNNLHMKLRFLWYIINIW